MITLEDIQKYLEGKVEKNLVLSHNTRMIDFGFDSLEIVELIAYVENLCSVEIQSC